MKRIILIIAITSLIMCGVLMAVGITNRQQEQPVIQNPSYSTPTLPTETLPPSPYDKLIPGNYYLIAGTNVNHYMQEKYLEYCLQNQYLRFEFQYDGGLTIWYHGNHVTEYSEKDGNIVLDNPNLLLDAYPFETEHDAEWLEQNQSTPVDTLTYVFDEETQILSIKYGIDSMELKYFPSEKDAAEWLTQYIPKDGGIHMPDYAHQYEEIASLIQ